MTFLIEADLVLCPLRESTVWQLIPSVVLWTVRVQWRQLVKCVPHNTFYEFTTIYTQMALGVSDICPPGEITLVLGDNTLVA